MAIKIITDSTADLSKEAYEKCEVIPLTVSFGTDEYIDGVDLSKDDFYTMLPKSETLPRTSQPSPAAFEEVYKKISADGDEAIVLTVSSKLSGTHQSALIAAEDYDNIKVFDSLNVAIGTGILVSYALRCVDEGKNLDETYALLEEKRSHVKLIALLDTLEYLKKGGRISKTAAFAGSMLNIKPVITITDGEIAVLGKARGSKKANNFLNEECHKDGVDYNMPVMLGYSGVSDEMLQNYISDSTDLWENKLDHLDISQIGTVVGTHAGPDAIAVAYFDEK